MIVRAPEPEVFDTVWTAREPLHKLMGTTRYPRLSNHVQETVVKPCAGIRMHGLKGEWGNRSARRTLRP